MTAKNLSCFGCLRFLTECGLPTLLFAHTNAIVTRFAPIQVVGRWKEYTSGLHCAARPVDRIFRVWIARASLGRQHETQVPAGTCTRHADAVGVRVAFLSGVLPETSAAFPEKNMSIRWSRGGRVAKPDSIPSAPVWNARSE